MGSHISRRDIPDGSRSTPGQHGCQTIDPLDREAINRRNHEWDQKVAPLFDAGIAGWGKADAFCEEFAIDKGYLSNMRAGKKPVPLRLIVPFLGNEGATRGFTSALLAEVKLAAVPVISEIRLEAGEAATLRAARAYLKENFWPAFRDRYALDRHHCSGTLLEVAIDMDGLSLARGLSR